MTDQYEKVGLDVRWKELAPGVWVQRDLYSSFLYSNYDSVLEKFDRDRCIQNFPGFLDMQKQVISDLLRQKKQGKVFPSCMGLDCVPEAFLASLNIAD